jgi:hypothetical protein
MNEKLNDPGTHVLVIGVSEYLHFHDGSQSTNNAKLFDMKQLSAAAHSASEFAAWMLNKYKNDRAPLSSLRVLLSPAPNEVVNADINNRLTGVTNDFSATRKNVEAELIQFRSVCDLHADNIAVVYVAGHGVQLTKNGSILLLHDCGSNNFPNLLDGALNMAGVHAGFNHPNTAQTQFWFVDACRQKPRIAKRFENLQGGLSLDEPNGSADSNAMYLAATTGTQAYARVGGLTLFCEALLWGLEGGIAAAPLTNLSNFWHVNTLSLFMGLNNRVQKLATAESATQSVDIAGRPNNAVFHEYPQTPKVDLCVELLPDAAANSCKGCLEDNTAVDVVIKNPPWPMYEKVDAGLYKIKIHPVRGLLNRLYSRLISLNPPDQYIKINVGP